MIFDACNQDVLLECLQSWNPEILHVRGEQVNMRILMKSFPKMGKSKTYVDCFIKRVRPRLAVTFVDNNMEFYSLSVRHRNIKTVFVQNGLRAYYSDVFERIARVNPSKNYFKVDYMMAFGSCIGAEYAKHIQGTIVPMGSLKNNSVPRTQAINKGMIAFVSQWHKDGLYIDGKFYTQGDYFGQIDSLIVKCLVLYAKEKNKQLVIIPRNSNHGDLRSEEETYFHELAGQECEFLELQGRYPSYQMIDAAEIVVTVDSTLGYESIARGTKTAVFAIRGTLLCIKGRTYGWPGDFPEEGPFWTNRPDPDTFVRILDYLFQVGAVQWEKDVEKTNFSSIMIYNPGNSIFKSILEKELGAAPVPPD